MDEEKKIYRLRTDKNITFFLPGKSADLADSVLKKSFNEDRYTLISFLEENPHLKNEGLLTKSENLKHNVSTNQAYGKIVDDMYIRTAILDINHRFGKEDSESQELVGKMREVLRYL
jgi:hypothetical protein